MKFLCDHMLGTLAKWLRFLGYDTAYPEVLEDSALRDMAADEGRVLITRDRQLAERVPGVVFVESDDPDVQFDQVVRTFHLTDHAAMSLCSVCNVPIRRADREEARGHVPEGVFERQKEWWKCDRCSRFYWRGSHFERVLARMNEAVAKSRT